MRIPGSFKSAFVPLQDKTIEVLPKTVAQSSLGRPVETWGETASESFAANVQPITDALLAQQLGLMAGTDLRATGVFTIGKGAFVRYDGHVYKVIENPHFDSHDELLLKRVDT